MRVGRTVVYHRRPGVGASAECNWFLWLLFALLVGIMTWAGPYQAFEAEVLKRAKSEAFTEATQSVVRLTPGAQSPPYHAVNRLVHVSSSGAPIADQSLVDADFEVYTSSNTLRLRRVTEYCQWVEHSTTHTVKHSDDSETTTRTYYYIKGWHSIRHPSLLFDQPFAHHNPQRDPAPSMSYSATGARFDAYHVSRPMIESMRAPWKQLHLTLEQQQRSQMSVAATANNFRYIGGGWFYSAYDPSIWERVGLAMGQAAEATLLDYQLGDLFSVCNAGDIRVHFQVMEPTHVSAVGTLAKSGEIEAAVMSNGYHLGLLHEGVLDPEDMFEADFNDHQWYIYMVRALTLLWACMMPGCLFWWFGSHGMPAKPFLAGTACLWTAIWAGTSCYVWGASSFTGAAAIIATIGYAMALQIHLSHTFVLAPAQAAPDAAAKKAF